MSERRHEHGQNPEYDATVFTILAKYGTGNACYICCSSLTLTHPSSITRAHSPRSLKCWFIGFSYRSVAFAVAPDHSYC